MHYVSDPMGMRRQLTFAKEPISSCFPAPRIFLHKLGFHGTEKSKNQANAVSSFIYGKDTGGNENWQYYFFDAQSGRSILLTDGVSRHQGLGWNAKTGDVVWTSNARDGKHFDAYIVTCADLVDFVKRAAIETNTKNKDNFLHAKMFFKSDISGYLWFPDMDENDLLLTRYVSVTESDLFLLEGVFSRNGEQIELRTDTSGSIQIGGENMSSDKDQPKEPASVGMNAIFYKEKKDSSKPEILFTSDRGSEFSTLRLWPRMEEKKKQMLMANFRVGPEVDWNVTGIAYHADSGDLAIVFNEDGFTSMYLGCNLKSFQRATISDVLPAELGIISGVEYDNKNNKSKKKRLGFTYMSPSNTPDVYIFEYEGSLSKLSSSNMLTRWTESETGGIDPNTFIPAKLVHVNSFDGLRIPAYVYCPPKNNSQGDKSDIKIPVIIHPHGGPEGQHRPSFSAFYQYLVLELGVCVIDPNVRGSDGYGKTFVSLDNGKNREDSVKDIGAILDWIGGDEQKVKSDLPAADLNLDPNRIGVWGGSYGGYMCLASLIHFNDKLKGGIDMVGISNFVTFLENTGEFRRELRRKKYGDESDPDMRQFLHSISPLTNCHKIKAPLMIAQGKNDPRVPISEAEQIFTAVQKNLKNQEDVWYMVADNEGHGFRKKENINAYQEAMVQFWKKYLI